MSFYDPLEDPKEKEIHETTCMDKIAAYAAAQEAWAKRWPDHCPKCLGEGGKSVPATRWEPGDFDWCSCLDELKCPRCGCVNEHWEDGSEDSCGNCNWRWGKGKEDAMPPDYECRHMP